MAATQAEGPKRVSDSAIIHTSMGDIHVKLFPVEYVYENCFKFIIGPFTNVVDIPFVPIPQLLSGVAYSSEKKILIES